MTTLYRTPVQEVPIEAFDVLEKDDILFIDSSHTSKSGGDVNIFYPFEYPDVWLVNRGVAWNELYFVRAFLSHNSTFQIMLFNSWLWREHPEIVERYFPESVNLRAHPEIVWRSLPQSVSLSPASLWLRRVA